MGYSSQKIIPIIRLGDLVCSSIEKGDIFAAFCIFRKSQLPIRQLDNAESLQRFIRDC